MPFVQRVVEPRWLSRTPLTDEEGKPRVRDEELEAVVNGTLCNALRQLASLMVIAQDIFAELDQQLQAVTERSGRLKVKIGRVEEAVQAYDPKKITVPEGDICEFAQLRVHYAAPAPPFPSCLDSSTCTGGTGGLFRASTRPTPVQQLYEAAARTPVHLMRQLDRWRRDGHRSSRFFLCTPVLGAKRRRIRNRVDIDIETRMPAAVEELRRWTSTEAFGDVTVAPDSSSRIMSNASVMIAPPAGFGCTSDIAVGGDLTDGGGTCVVSDDEAIDHKLPSPEEQVQVIALKFPAELVPVDISGKSFDRMSGLRRSLLHADPNAAAATAANAAASATATTSSGQRTTDGGSVRRRGRSRKPRNRRRNTLAGTDQKEIRDALCTAGEDAPSSVPTDEQESPEHAATCSSSPPTVGRSKSSDILRSSSIKKESPEYKKSSHFNTLKQWGMNRLKMINSKISSSESKGASSDLDPDDINIYETITIRRKRSVDKDRNKTLHERKPSCSSSEKSSINIPINTPLSAAMNIAVRLRDSSMQSRLRRSGAGKDEPHSSSGNWSASSESGRASIGSEITSTTVPKSTTSAATSSNSLNQHAPSSVNSRRRFNINMSTSSSVTSEGTLTPDIIHDLHEDGETSSVYSCDTEGYYTSFHMDSGLKTLKEEDGPMTPLHSTTAFSNSSSYNTVLSAENEYELFGKGSTSTTTSSAGTVCTTLRAADSNRSLIIGPAVPERKSSLSKLSSKSPESSLERDFGTSDKTGTVKRSPSTTKAMVHQSNGDISPDSGHNTSSSPIESISSPNCGGRSCSEFEYSESSDMEGADRIERIRVKTTMSSARIPSMCVITPQNSDDESVKSQQLEHIDVFDYADNSTKLDSKYNINLLLKPHTTDLDILKFSSESIANNNKEIETSRVLTTPIHGSTKLELLNVNPQTGYATVEIVDAPSDECNKEKSSSVTNLKMTRAPSPSGGSVTVKQTTTPTKSPQLQPIIKATLMPLNNMFGRLRSNLSNFSRRDSKSPIKNNQVDVDNTDHGFTDDTGDYVTIADVKNNNEKAANTIYSNDVVNRNLLTVLSGKIRETEYVSLNDLPCNETDASSATVNCADSLERTRRQGARVTLNADGHVVYSSDSLKRRKAAHTTFEPGPFVKSTEGISQSPLPSHRAPKVIRPVANSSRPSDDQRRPLSPQLGKVVIRASSGTTEIIRMPPTTIVTPNTINSNNSPSNTAHPVSLRGAYVHMQDNAVVGPPATTLMKAITSTTNEQSAYGGNRTETAHSPSKSQSSPGNMHHRNMGATYYETHQQSPTHGAAPFYQGAQYSPHLTDPAYEKSFTHQRGASVYSTLPTRKQQYHYIHDEERSVTPDIMRGLGSRQIYSQHEFEGFVEYPPRQPEYMEPLHQQIGIPEMYDNRHIEQYKPGTPTNTARHFSPIKSQNDVKISPIDPRNIGGSFHSSTPSRIEPKAAIANLDSKLMSPKKCTMTTEELYAAIHKSKKKLNINTDDLETSSRGSPVGSLSPGRSDSSLNKVPLAKPETGYLDKSKSRLSWSPSKGDYVDFNTNVDLSPRSLDGRNRQSWACSDRKGPTQTSRLDFKRLLLQHGKSSGPTRKISAVEQLKISRQLAANNAEDQQQIIDLSGSPRMLGNNRKFPQNTAPGSPRAGAAANDKNRAKPKILSPKSSWRFNNPRSDVLSSTILEDCREEETSPNSSAEAKSTKSTAQPVQNCIAPNGNTNPTDNRNAQILNQMDNKLQTKIHIDNRVPIVQTQSFVITAQATKQQLLGSQTMATMTASQRLQAQRAKFFNSTPISSGTMGNSTSSFRRGTAIGAKSETGKCSPPTLETAF